jgi:hypothetical protein
VGEFANQLDLGGRLEWVTAWIHDHLFTGSRRIWITAAIVCLLTWQIAFSLPTPGLDLSWMGGLYMAVHSGKDFGSEVVFTYGPLGFLEWPGVWEGWLGVLAFLFLALIFYSFAVILIDALERSVGLLAAALIAFFFFVTLPDLEQVPLALGMGLCFLALREDRPNWGVPLLAAGGGALAASEALIKLSVGPEIFLACLLAMIGARARQRDWGVFVGTFVGGALVLWLIAGQSLGSIWDYAENGLQIISGYNEAMSVEMFLTTWDGIVLVLSAVGVVVATVFAPWRDLRARVCAVLAAAVAGFSSYKYGIVRFEPSHVALGLSALFGIWLLLPWRRPTAMTFVGATVVVGAIIVHVYPTPFRLDVIDNLTTFRQQVELAARPGLRQLRADEQRASLQATYDLDPETLALLRGRSVAIDPWEISVAWAYELDWSPLPVFQNYSAYTRKLDELNAETVENPDGPEVILRQNPGGPGPWGARSNEGRLPAWDPPLQNEAITCNFVPVHTTLSWQVLGRVENRCLEPELISEGTAQAGEEIEIPQSGPNAFVVLDLSGAGIEGFEKLKSMLWKPPVRTAVLNSGEATYRLIPGTSGDGLIVSRSKSLASSGAFEQLPELHHLRIEGVGRTLGLKFYRVKVKPVVRRLG